MQQTLPEPRKGVLGSWDRLVGPGMTLGENVIVIGVSIVSAALVGLYLHALGFDWVRVLIGSVVAFDVVGGAVCNMTDTTKRWHHRPGQTAKDRFAFIALHLFHIALVAWLFRGGAFDLSYLIVLGGWLVASGLIVATARDALKQPLAATAYIAASALVIYVLGPTPGLEWFGPILFIKLLMGHATPLR